MPRDTVVDELLATLYHAHFVVDEAWDVERVPGAGAERRTRMKEACDDLCARGLARYVWGSYARLTPEGVRHSEERGVVDPGVVEHNRRVREALLGCLERCYVRRGPDTVLEWQVAQRESGVQVIDFERNIEYLVSFGLAEWAEPGCLRITPLGRSAVSGAPPRAAGPA